MAITRHWAGVLLPHARMEVHVRTSTDSQQVGPGAVDDRPLPTVIVYPDGPLILRGGVVVQDSTGELLSEGRVVALCRCGRSALKPFCDGSHKRAPSASSSSRRDKDVVSPQRTGPLGPAAENVVGEPPVDV